MCRCRSNMHMSQNHQQVMQVMNQWHDIDESQGQESRLINWLVACLLGCLLGCSVGWLIGLLGGRAEDKSTRVKCGRDSQSHIDFEGVVNSPLSGCQSSNHGNTQAKPPGSQLPPPHLLHYAPNCCVLQIPYSGHTQAAMCAV